MGRRKRNLQKRETNSSDDTGKHKEPKAQARRMRLMQKPPPREEIGMPKFEFAGYVSEGDDDELSMNATKKKNMPRGAVKRANRLSVASATSFEHKQARILEKSPKHKQLKILPNSKQAAVVLAKVATVDSKEDDEYDEDDEGETGADAAEVSDHHEQQPEDKDDVETENIWWVDLEEWKDASLYEFGRAYAHRDSENPIEKKSSPPEDWQRKVPAEEALTILFDVQDNQPIAQMPRLQPTNLQPIPPKLQLAELDEDDLDGLPEENRDILLAHYKHKWKAVRRNWVKHRRAYINERVGANLEILDALRVNAEEQATAENNIVEPMQRVTLNR